MDSDEGKLFVGGIAWDTTEDKLKEHFEKYGQVREAVIMRDQITKRPRGFGFVVFDDPSNLDAAIQEKHSINGRTVEAKRALSREEQRTSQNPVRSNVGGAGNYRTKKIFVGGLPTALTEEEFRQYFETYGKVTDVVIMYDPNTKRPRGFGFITFDSESMVERVLHKSFHELNNKMVEVKPALPKEVSPGGAVVSQIVGGYGPSSYPPTTFDGQSIGGNRLMQVPTSNGPFVSYPNFGMPTYAYPMPNIGYGGYSGGYSGSYVAGPSSSYLGGPSGPMSNPWINQYPHGYIGGAVSGLIVPTMYGNYVGPDSYMSTRTGNGPKRNVVTSSRARGQHGSPAMRSSDS
ncbi:heterogeneous nuclear ribonucleoprotein 1-like [Impatiens glandulifera]|uniref:heterogeneous nuclear ribonucleoprotein 1-like n=1 Tax=Impatiens glandulifera TaxID=253017 RepID=UPI001FB134BE|nr:heterogeneous nuclear ribonucleoprotein 1-like [Impatiens glandulifera]